MTTRHNDDRFAAYLDQYISYLEGEADRPVIDHLGPADRQDLSAMFRVIEAWASELELPTFEEDHVALALGLVPSASAGAPVTAVQRLQMSLLAYLGSCLSSE